MCVCWVYRRGCQLCVAAVSFGCQSVKCVSVRCGSVRCVSVRRVSVRCVSAWCTSSVSAEHVSPGNVSWMCQLGVSSVCVSAVDVIRQVQLQAGHHTVMLACRAVAVPHLTLLVEGRTPLPPACRCCCRHWGCWCCWRWW